MFDILGHIVLTAVVPHGSAAGSGAPAGDTLGQTVLTAVIIAIITLVITGLSGFLAWLLFRRPFQHWQRSKALYEIPCQVSSSLKPGQFLGRRPFDPYYVLRPEDQKIRDCIARGDHCCVVGSPLAGKTRAIHEALKRAEPSLAITKPHCADIAIADFVMPFSWKWWQRRVLVLDDVDKFADKQNCLYLNDHFLEKKAIILATCRSGDELAKARNRLEALFLLIGQNIVTLSHLSDVEGQELCRRLGRPWDPATFDGTPGSLVLPLEAMKQRFGSCGVEGKAILRAIRQLYLAGIYEEKEAFRLSQIKLLCRESYGIVNAPEYQWQSWFEDLGKAGFLEVRGQDRVWAEEAYLLRVVTPFAPETQLDLLQRMAQVFNTDPEALFLLGNNALGWGEVRLEKAEFMKIAIEAYTQALKVRTLAAFPVQYATTQNNLGTAYRGLSEVRDKEANLGKAIAACTQALKVFTPEEFPQYNQVVKANLGRVESSLSQGG